MGILEQYMLWKLLKKNDKEKVEGEKGKKKKICDKLWKSKKSKKLKMWKKMTSSKRLWKENL